MTSTGLSDFGEIYSAYAAGCLDPAFALMVETQAALRSDVARALARAETIAGICLENEESVALSARALDSALAAIDALEHETETQRRAAQLAGDAIEELLALPQPLRETALESCASNGWASLTPGVRRLKLDLDSSADVELYRIEPGQTVPRHSHRGSELTLVVAGGYTDESGQFGPGDLAIKGPEDTHQPTGDMDGVCFALAVRDAGLEFTGALGFLQRMLGR